MISVKLADFNLTSNPFPTSTGTPTERVLKIWADRDEVKKVLEATIKKAVRNKSTEIILLHGDVGSGKTHTLKYFKKILDGGEFLGGELSKYSVIPFYIPDPGNRFLDLYRRFIVEVGKDRLVDFAREFAGVVYKTFLERLLKKVEDEDIRRDELPMYFKDEFVNSEIRDIIKLEVDRFPNFGMVLFELRDKEVEDLAWSWLIGQKLYSADIRNLQVRGEIDSDEDALRAFSALIQILKNVDHDEIFIFVDEMESMVKLASNEVRSYSEFLRRFIDEHSEGVFLVLGCTKAQWKDLLERFVPAFLSRVPQRNRIELGNLTPEEAKKLIIDYLNSARIETPTTPTERLNPFNEKSVEEICKKSDNKLRDILQNTRSLLEDAISENVAKITADFAAKKIEEYKTTSS